MKLLLLDELSSRHWTACTPCVSATECNLLISIEEFLADHGFSRSVIQLMATLKAALEHPEGPNFLKSNLNLCHEAIEGEGIYELKKGRLRMYWFYGADRRVIMIISVAIKKTNKTSSKIRNSLLSVKSQYQQAYKENLIEYINA